MAEYSQVRRRSFLELLVNHLSEQGTVDLARFYESPYADLSDQGISGVRPDADVQRIIAVVNEIKLKAVA
jgi:type I restriction enzyme R subunit